MSLRLALQKIYTLCVKTVTVSDFTCNKLPGIHLLILLHWCILHLHALRAIGSDAFRGHSLCYFQEKKCEGRGEKIQAKMMRGHSCEAKKWAHIMCRLGRGGSEMKD